MAEPMTRGHIILHTAGFMQTGAPVAKHHLDIETSIELRTALDAMSAAAFYPRKYQSELLAALADARGRGDGGYAALRDCGAALRSTRNEFNALLLKVLTPELFIKKLPRFWLRDHGAAGTCDVESLDAGVGAARVRLHGVGGYLHAGIFWLGFIEGMLAEVAGATPVVEQSGWSWVDPAPNQIVYEVRWS
jgi:hypothetical protein